jgi:hypothetical protein
MGYLKTVDIGGREFAARADSTPTSIGGGVQGTRLMNGDGSSRNLKQAVAWKYSNVTLSLDPDRADIEYLRNVQKGDDVDLVFTDMDELSYQGVGNIEGELSIDHATDSCTVEFTGGGEVKLM